MASRGDGGFAISSRRGIDLGGEHKDPGSVNQDQEILRLSEGWYDWLQRHPEYGKRSRQDQLHGLCRRVGQQYASLMAEVEKSYPQRKAEVGELFGMFFASSRILRGLLNFCAEMQANMQSKMLLYLFYRKIEGIPACSGVQPSYWDGDAISPVHLHQPECFC